MPTIVKDRRHSKSQSEMGNKFASCFAHGVVKKTRNDDVDEYSITRLPIEDEHWEAIPFVICGVYLLSRPPQSLYLEYLTL